MSLEAADFSAGFDVPKPSYPVITAGEQRGAIRGESDACDDICVTVIDLNRQRRSPFNRPPKQRICKDRSAGGIAVSLP